MSDFGIFASRFQVNNEILDDFENTIRYLRKKERKTNPNKDEKYIQVLSEILLPLTQSIEGQLSNSLSFENQTIAEILKKRKSKTWPTYKNDLIKLKEKISGGNLFLSESEITILNDIADAMDIECSKLFKRMRRYL